MTDYNKYVDTDYSGGGNNGSQSNPYTSIDSWDSNEEEPSVGASDKYICNFKSGTNDDTSSVNLIGW